MNRSAASSADTTRRALSFTFFPYAAVTALATFPFTPKSQRTTTLFPSTEPAASTTNSTTFDVRSAASFFFHATTRLPYEPSVSRSRTFLPADMDRPSSSTVRSFTLASSSRPSSFPASATLASKSAAATVATSASLIVTPVILLTPLAIPSSLSSTNPPASDVFFRWVPPQNSTLYAFHCASWGFPRICVTGAGLTATTRTGSGYTSPNTARSEDIFWASSSGAT
mmetsp:Transcript_30018/g.63664  ORF Transcript_30018/g.63664 Transcript_30018/m.63664 type:complete len:226 (-) Transcript_30018:2158-2835(-)